MEEAIKGFAEQFRFAPVIEGAERLPAFDPSRGWRAVVGGMGGSHLAADVLAAANRNVPLLVHRSYGLPVIPEGDAARTLFIASSYSGNTEETIDFAKAARAKGYPLAAISVGGALEAFAREEGVPYVKVPDTGIQPRSALGFSMAALGALIGDAALRKEIASLADTLEPDAWEAEGAALAEKLRGSIPVIYASEENAPVAYNWKIKFNETGKVPAFQNVFPELNHNELAGMDVISGTAALSKGLHFIFLRDDQDHPRIKVRMEVTEKLYRERGLSVSTFSLKGASRLERTFNSLLLADWAAVKTARGYGAEPQQVAIIETFKKLIA